MVFSLFNCFLHWLVEINKSNILLVEYLFQIIRALFLKIENHRVNTKIKNIFISRKKKNSSIKDRRLLYGNTKSLIRCKYVSLRTDGVIYHICVRLVG
jgi:hypothetical protein